MGNLSNKVVLVTGASRGIGRAIAKRFAEEGADVIVTARTAADLETLQTEIEALGVRCQPIATDLRDPAQIDALAAAALEAFGRVDVLVNNAGVGTWADVTDITLEQFDDMFNVNIRAVFLLTKALLPQMTERETGHIINIASTSSRWTYPSGTVYCATKFAVLGFNEALAKELRITGVRVTAVCPGMVNTYLGGAKPEDWTEGMLNPEDVAEMAVQAALMPQHAIVTEMVVWPRAEEF